MNHPILPPDLSGLSYLHLEGYLLVRSEDLAAFVQGKVQEAAEQTARRFQERLLTSREVAKILGVSQTTVSNLITSGKLQSIRVAAKTPRIRAADLEAYLHQNTIGPHLSGLERLQALTGVSFEIKPRRGRPRKEVPAEDLRKLNLTVDT